MNEDFTLYDLKPDAFLNYLRYYGMHFNRKLCEFACSQLGTTEFTKDKLDSILRSHNIELKGAKLYDGVYIANWCKSLFYGSSIEDERHLVLFIRDLFEKEGELLFNRWYADVAKKGIPIEWSDMI